ncbi:Maf-like protein [Echinicola pacifica]|uniref:dTTP/UTP pyrophosphatase n=1 Tax=Echinicola pacifica TaxID=346377 RepID=A0A918USG9_9BACT|nr:Maf family nucleotide pyrophosphatase [Echinicola pacifica]GGZ30282.1 Maf-like protein [Echinicola pacifica]
MVLGKRIILGSKSPRRRELLAGLEIPFEVKSKDVNEDFPLDMAHNKVAAYLAEKKAMAYEGELAEDEIVITSDTTVLVNGQILNKPGNKTEAMEMLKLLSGNVHQVVSGVCIMDNTKKLVFDDMTEVHFKSLSEEEISAYIDKHQPYDKAGSYGVQEWIGYVAVYKLVGSFYTVMGLPVHKVYETLKSW